MKFSRSRSFRCDLGKILWQLKMAAENPGTAAKEAYDEKVGLDAACE